MSSGNLLRVEPNCHKRLEQDFVVFGKRVIYRIAGSDSIGVHCGVRVVRVGLWGDIKVVPEEGDWLEQVGEVLRVPEGEGGDVEIE